MQAFPVGLYTFKNLNPDHNHQLNNFINQYPFAQQQNIYKQIQNNLSAVQAQIQQQNFQLSSFLQELFAANGNYGNNMWGGGPIGIYNGNEVPNGNVDNNSSVQPPNDEKPPVIVLLSQDEIRKWGVGMDFYVNFNKLYFDFCFFFFIFFVGGFIFRTVGFCLFSLSLKGNSLITLARILFLLKRKKPFISPAWRCAKTR